MDPVTQDLLGWLAGELSCVLLEDGEGGRVHVAIGGPDDLDGKAAPEGSLAEAVCAIAGADSDASEVQAVVERARAGERGRATLRDRGDVVGFALAWPREAGQARVLIVPEPDDRALRRRAAAAELAAGVTHEVANALTAIAGWTRMASASQPLPERTRQALHVVQRSAREALGSARGLLRTMRDTGSPSIHPSGDDPTLVDEVVRQVLEALAPELDEASIALEASLEPTIHAAAPASTLRLIVSNLVRNAFEALDGPGTIRVSTQRRGERFVLSVADDGPGMSAGTLASAFDRYFTTKETGTGLGLAMVRDTVEEAGGRVEVESRRGTGTRFDIWLPLAGAAAMSLRPPQVTSVSSGVHPRPFLFERRVLVADDDEAMRTMVRTALEIHGAHVDVARDRETALAHAGPYDVALVDLALGSDRGDALIEDLLALGRTRQALLMSGSTDAQAPPGSALLRKPFELADLQRALEPLVSEPPREAEG